MNIPIPQPAEPETNPSREQPTLPQKDEPSKIPEPRPVIKPTEPLTEPSREKPTKTPQPQPGER